MIAPFDLSLSENSTLLSIQVFMIPDCMRGIYVGH